MADISKWLEMLVGPQIAGLVGGGGKSPMPGAAPVPAGPPAIAPGAVDTSVAPVNVLDNGPGLNELLAPEDPIGVLSQGPIQTYGQPLNEAMGIDPPDPNRVENTGSLMPSLGGELPVADIPPIAPPAAIAEPLAARKAAARPFPKPADRPLSNVAVGASRMWNGGGFGKPIDWRNNKLMRQ